MKLSILNAIDKYNTVYIYRHEKPDPDAIGSQLGLAELLAHNYPDKNIAIRGEEEPSLTFLADMTEETEGLDALENSLVIVCDTANTERIDGEGWDKGAQLIKIDHHPDVEPYGDIMWVNTEASSTCEMIVDLAMTGKKEKEWMLTEEAARLLYAGIVGDTGRFQFSNTTPQTLKYAAEVLEYGFDTTELFTRFYESEEQLVRLKGRVLQDFILTKNGLGIVYLTQDLLKEYGVSVNESSAVVNSFSETKGLKSWVFFVENEDGTYRVRLRSKGPVVNEVAAKHNGGGHSMAAGAKAADKKEIETIISELEERCKQFS